MNVTFQTTRGWLRVFGLAASVGFAMPVAGQAKPEDGSFEINGDNGSVILPNGNIRSPGPKSPLQTKFDWEGAGKYWEHWTDTTYMGRQCYKVRIIRSSTGRDRSEQTIMDDWDIGPASRHVHSHYFSFAFYVETPPPRTSEAHCFVSQLWQCKPLNPILYVGLNKGGRYLVVAARGDVIRNGGLYKNVWTDLLDPVHNSGTTMPLQVGRWYRFMFRVTPSRGLLSLGRAMVWLMDNETGEWVLKGDVSNVPLGFTTKVPDNDPRPPEQLLKDFFRGKLTPADKSNLTWKVGTYRGAMNVTTRVYVDNARFTTDSWNAITKDRTIGYHRNIFHLGFEETGGDTAYDRSGTWNGGWSYRNHGKLFGPRRQRNLGVRGSCLSFDGRDDYVRIPVAKSEHEFDTGNYLTLGAWIKPSASQVNKGLITVDDSTRFKARLRYLSDDTVEFAVRHPDNSLSYVRGQTPYPLTKYGWHQITGTFNRWAKLGKRIKIYVDGKLIKTDSAADKPIWSAEDYVYIGKYSSRYYFKGSIDEPMLFNFELSQAQVQSIADWYHNGALLPFGQGCLGSNGRLEHSATGNPEIGNRVNYVVSGGPGSGIGICSLGFSNRQWGPFRLPLALDFLGAKGCSLYTGPVLYLGVVLNSSGLGSVPLTLPPGKQYIGATHYTQYMALDPQANSWGITYSNGLETHVGGRR